jgi:hypothetical protein
MSPEERKAARREYQKKWYQTNKTKMREYHRQYRATNAEKISANRKEWLGDEENAANLAKSQRQWTVNNADRLHGFELTRRYGLGAKEHYDTQAVQQAGLCAICGKSSKRRLHLDHNHSTGGLRGLLCGKCNHLLGNADERLEVLEKAISYLKFWNYGIT